MSPKRDSVIEVSEEELPLSCPRRQEEISDKHPRVYLPIEGSGYVMCPYCSMEYRLRKPLD